MSSDEYCRLCGTSDEVLTDIFSENDTSTRILFKIRILLYVSISKDDEYSHLICSSCVAKVQEYYSFTKKFQQIQFRLFEENTVSIWKMEINDCDVLSNGSECIKVENHDTSGAVEDEIVEKELYLGSDMDDSSDENHLSSKGDLSPVHIDENITPSLESDTSLDQIDKKDNPPVKDEPSEQKCDPSTNENSANKISFSKLAGFLRSKVKVNLKTAKESPALNDALENSSKNTKFCGNNFSMRTVVKYPATEDVGSSLSDGHSMEETVDSEVTKRISNIALFRTSTPKDGPAFKKKFLFLTTNSGSPHRKTRKKDKNSVKCPYCGEDFTRDEFETEHMVLHTEDPQLQKIILDHVSPLPSTQQLDCDECKMSFYRELAYIEHMNQHLDLRPVKCHMCDRHFFGHKRTKSHFRSAHLMSTFKCESCPYMAKTLSDLEKHRRGVHMNERIMCNVCGKLLSAFAHNMKKHLETHNETRPYKCEFCDASFKTSASVARHRENIHFPESVMCSSCGIVCKSKQKYKKHAYKCKRRLKRIDL